MENELLHRQNEYLMALHQTTLGLISRLEINNLLLDIIARAARLMNTEHGYIYLLNAEGTTLVSHVQLGLFDTFPHQELSKGMGMAGKVWESEKSFRVDNYQLWPGRLQDPHRDILRAMMGVPLKSGGEVIGVIGLAYVDDEKRFDDTKVVLLTRFAELASLALDNARLYESLQKELADRKNAEERLRKFSFAVDQSPISIIITDLQGHIEYTNPHFTITTGYSLDELKGQLPPVLSPDNRPEEDYRNLWATLLAGGEWRGEFQSCKKNGELYWEHAMISPLRNDNDDITNFIVIKEDISEQKKLENQLRHSQKMEAVGQLAGGIAHDFNNILTAIIGYATILQTIISTDSRANSMLDHIIATAERGASLTQGLLAFSRKQISDPKMVNLNEVIKRVNILLLRLIGETVHLQTVLSEQDLLIIADSVQIEQVLMNLATNARDSMPDGGTIVIKTEMTTLDYNFVSSHGFGDPGRYALITVSDTGYGMDEEVVKRIFEPFYTTKETGKGTGLGLSIVYGIIKKHGGLITCQSAPGKGAAFHVYLPLHDNLEPLAFVEKTTLPFQRGNELILLVEDDESIRSLTKELLEEFGYSVIEALQGEHALEIFREQKDCIKMVILDGIMPGMKCCDIYKEIKAMKPDVRILIYSGYNPESIQGISDLGENLNFISKPFMPKELLMKIREVFGDAA
jgi:PAS domain S-box-containing protein